MGAIVGSVAAEAVRTETTVWGEHAQTAIGHAEALLREGFVPLDLAVGESIPTAVGLANQASPLLINAGTVDVIDHVRAWLNDHRFEPLTELDLAAAAQTGANGTTFSDAVEQATTLDEAIMVGALRGLALGIGDIPARLASSLRSPDGRRDRRYFSRLVDRLLGLHRTDWYEPRGVRGPSEALPGLWLSNLYGVSSFVRDHPDGLVLSLCDVEGRLDEHDEQITFHLDDVANPIANPSLTTVLDDVLNEIRSAREQGQPVLVHCRHGASRTGLTLRLILIEEQGLSADDALTEAQCLWSHTSSWNKAWARETERRTCVDSESAG